MRPSLTWIHNQAMHPATSEQRKNLRHQGAGTKNLRDAPSNCKFNELHQGASVRPELSSMSDPTSSALAAITSVASSVPAQVQTAFHAALSQLLGGLTAIPAAWSKQKAQAIEDVTVGRSLVAASLAKAVAEPERKPYILRYASVSLARLELAKNDRYTRGQKLILAIGLPFGLTILAVNISGALGASESIKDNIVLAGMSVFLIGLGWATWTWVRKPRRMSDNHP
jgi:hypothetical protein